ncbi:N-acetylglutaminylglutamine amidotransferase [Ignatzschineria rhizosphaerae]|uniref:asparagine synthase (glutamine-hydrolyzing) n=1 Tax=Ignatzschineria rhizosphaerae TaxID=2923279 RepID=A0ABY3WZZ0_9GAMM|nr:N-acetylglutaminylglutamine amidotransferase [Ignatzschineria rhizosphaerae]UNM96192.1 N-acetylglutaminylglutamine amidotransferase [Ignatzschineria rhizosphaerae]
MSGIAGVLKLNQTAVDESLLQKMSEPIIKRGPDGTSVFRHKMVGLIQTKLQAISNGDEPFLDEKIGISVVTNGTIYNQDALRETLREMGYQFLTQSQAEVLTKAYHCWGHQFVERLDGAYAIALWDDQAETLLLVRDRFGKKPLYYSFGKAHDAFYFASNTQSILQSQDIDTSIDPEALHFMYSLHAVVPAPLTILKGIRKVEPGSYMVIKNNGIAKETSYWELTATRDYPDDDYETWKEIIESSLKSAIKKEMGFANEKVGVLLSGGLDSTLITALAIEEGFKDIQTFSVGFEDQPEEKGSEFFYSDQFVDKYQTDHYKFEVPNSEALTRLPEAIRNMSEPLFGQDAIGFYLLSEKVKSITSVVQSGQGADEVFAGYFWYPKMVESQELDPLKRFSEHYFDRPHEEWLQAFTSKYHTHDVAGDFIRDHLTKSGATTFLDRVLRLDVTRLVVDDPVKRVDNMTMAHALEARMPFMDQRLVELAMAMPPEYKLMHHGKGILKDIARGRVPDSIIDRPKAYFPMPALKYVRGEFLEMMQDLLTSEKSRSRGIFNEAYIQDLLKNPEAPSSFTNIQGSKLWHAALLELWLQSVGL